MATSIDLSTTLYARLRRAFAIGLVTAAALHGLASIPAEASPKTEMGRPPVVRPPVVKPPRTGIDGARGYKGPQELMRDRWGELFVELATNPPKFNKKTKKWEFKSTNETFHNYELAKEAWWIMKSVSTQLMIGDVAQAKVNWKSHKRSIKKFWYGRDVYGKRNRDTSYGADKAGKARAKADEAAERNVMDKLWKGLKSAEAKGLKRGKSTSPVTN